ncbi:MAG: hypothetical protein O7F15_03520 [Gammaproteobacteria bacterium]|nr:hypothetical protein [Gammaproteobacteria bacterium]MCZ6882060.1 hypothetical protein [Gammaproteobacteria bacterium]
MNHKSIKFILVLACFTANIWISPARSADLPQLEVGRGLVVFYRLGKFGGSAIRFNLNHSEGFMGQLLNDTWLYKSVGPGEQTFWSQVISQDSITIMVEAGKTYYVKGVVKMGVFAGRPTFIQVSEQEGLRDLAGL